MKHGGSAPCFLSVYPTRTEGRGKPYTLQVNSMTNKFTDIEKLAEIWTEARTHLRAALPEITRLMKEKFAEVHGKPELGSALDQLGLSDGAVVVSGWIAQNELGLALEHLCYMVNEVDLPISAKTYAHLKSAEQVMQIELVALRQIVSPSR